eukprot:6743786-Karenia_brevis.AAC.1
MDLQFAVATDDVMIFSTTRARSEAAARQLDAAMHVADLQRNKRKDINGAKDATCIGIDLVEGKFWDARE